MTRSVYSVHDVRRAARRRLPRIAFDFIDGGAEDETTLHANREAFRRWALRPRHLRGTAERDQSTTVLGERLSSPVILGPAGMQRIAHRLGEVAAARAAASAGTRYALSSYSSLRLEEVAAAAPPPTVWFQIYLWKDRRSNEELLERVRRAGIRVLIVTVDSPLSGKRERDLRNGFTLPLRPNVRMAADLAANPRWLVDYLRGGQITFANFTEIGAGKRPAALFAYVNQELAFPGATIDELHWLRERWEGPLVIKGTMTAEDAVEAVECGVDGICVSNHGGRQVDGALASLEALPEIVAAAPSVEVFFDGGVRRGSEVLKALALGARAVFVARPYLFGLAMDGQRGAELVLEIYRDEIDVTMALIGRRSLDGIDDGSVVRRASPDPAPTATTT